MDRALSDIIIAAFAVSMICGSTVYAYWLSLRAKQQARQERLASGDALRAEMDALRDDLGGQIAELQERVDFAERMLAQGRPVERLSRPDTTPV